MILLQRQPDADGGRVIASFTTSSTLGIDALTSSTVLPIRYIIGGYAFGFGVVLLGQEAARWIIDVTPAETKKILFFRQK